MRMWCALPQSNQSYDWLTNYPSLLWVLPADTSLPHSICSPGLTRAATSTPAICLISHCLSWFHINCRINLIWQMGIKPTNERSKFVLELPSSLKRGNLISLTSGLESFWQSQKILDTMDFSYPSGIYPLLAQIIKSCLWQHCYLKEYSSPEIQHSDSLQVRQPHLSILSNYRSLQYDGSPVHEVFTSNTLLSQCFLTSAKLSNLQNRNVVSAIFLHRKYHM